MFVGAVLPRAARGPPEEALLLVQATTTGTVTMDTGRTPKVKNPGVNYMDGTSVFSPERGVDFTGVSHRQGSPLHQHPLRRTHTGKVSATQQLHTRC